MASGAAGFAGAGGVGIGAGTFAAAELGAEAFVAGLVATVGAECDEAASDGAAELAEAAEFFTGVFAGADFDTFAASESVALALALDESDAGSDFFSDSFFFAVAEITMEMT